MNNLVKIISVILIITTSCFDNEPDLPNILRFTEGISNFEFPAKAIRIRKHKTISLNINSEENTNGIDIAIQVPEYAKPDNYKNIPDSFLITDEKINIFYISSKYYESVEAKVLVISDNDKIIKGEFEFTAINAFDSTDIINVKNGYFEIGYSPSIAIEEKY